MMAPRVAWTIVGLCTTYWITGVAAQDFTYLPAGELVSGSGDGRADETIYVPGMRFPIEEAPAYANSQVWGPGGSEGPGGGQCDIENYSYPWQDNYCESREWEMPLCPAGTGHQGQDIRPATCDANLYWCVAVDDGTITYIGEYSVTLVTEDGTQHRYLHMQPDSLVVGVGDEVVRGQRLGQVSDAFGSSITTIHLHYDIFLNLDGYGGVFVPPYTSLVQAYTELIDQPIVPCDEIPPPGGVLDDSGPCFRLHGPTATWRHVVGAGYNDDLHWTNGWTSATPGNWAEWRLHFVEAGSYLVEAHVVQAYALSTQVPYTVRHAGQEADLSISQAGHDGWLEVGTFVFAAGADQFVALYDNTGEDSADERRITADALRLTRLNSEDDPASCDCSSGSEPALPTLLLLALLWWRSRYRTTAEQQGRSNYNILI